MSERQVNVDFLVDGLVVVECFGDYWHCNPIMFMPGDYNRSLHSTASEKWAKDQRRKQALEARGYAFASFWESDIHGHPVQTRAALREPLKRN